MTTKKTVVNNKHNVKKMAKIVHLRFVNVYVTLSHQLTKVINRKRFTKNTQLCGKILTNIELIAI